MAALRELGAARRAQRMVKSFAHKCKSRVSYSKAMEIMADDRDFLDPSEVEHLRQHMEKIRAHNDALEQVH